ncbi:neutral zinc metallopeptidase [Streptosporangium sp. NBC_01495]|uniref:neutral zinc metallopeptidase n=1 Tax=Streptosporangium sp. NBC_01495 TaxID=2903899 RepID=UPI002E359A67|nr:neutral zinc metallopeptidase [Streptosporangium sp. NBC_01495]
MRTLFVALAIGALMSTSLIGTASSDSTGPVPTGTAALTGNPVYKTGKFVPKTCEEPTIRGGDIESVQIYADNMAACLGRAWQTQLKKAGIPFSKPKVTVAYGDRIKTACGVYRPGDTFGLYCQKNRTVYLMVTEYGITGELDSPEMLESLSIGYGYHVQRLIGVLAQEARAAKKLSRTGALALSSKVALQNICFTGAFLGSVWDSLGHTKEHGYDYLIDRRSVESSVKGNGTTKNRIHWMRRGFDAQSPGACNTFKAPASKVA